MQVGKIVVGSIGLLLLLVGNSLIAGDKGGGDFSLPIGVILVAGGALLMYAAFVGGIIKASEQTPPPDQGDQNIWQGFLRLHLIRKVSVLVAFGLIAFAGLLIVAFFANPKDEIGDILLFVACGIGYSGITIFKRAWPSALANLRNSRY